MMKTLIQLSISTFILLVGLSCQTKEDKEVKAMQSIIIAKSDSVLLYSKKLTYDFIEANSDKTCQEKNINFKKVQKEYNHIATYYRQQSTLLNLPEDTIRKRLGMANLVLQDKDLSKCVGLEEGYDQFQYFLTKLKLQR